LSLLFNIQNSGNLIESRSHKKRGEDLELYTAYNNLCEIPDRNASIFPSRMSHKFRHATGFSSKTFTEFRDDITALSAGFSSFGIKKGSHVSFFCNNRYEWAVSDYALMLCGAVSVPHGSDTPPA